MTANKEFKNKVAIVTGASSGIGKATALAFAREGAKVMVADITNDGEETVALIRKEHGEALFQKCDVSKISDVKNMVETAIKHFDRLDYAFNNAGVEGKPASTVDCKEENWNQTISVNLSGVWFCMKYEIPYMLKNPGSAIVNCSSVLGLVGIEAMPAYAASKHGVVGLTKVAALDYAKNGLRVNAVCPGAIETPMLSRFTGGTEEGMQSLIDTTEPVGRVGNPNEIAETVLWLCSSRASFVTGQALAVDGGWTVR